MSETFTLTTIILFDHFLIQSITSAGKLAYLQKPLRKGLQAYKHLGHLIEFALMFVTHDSYRISVISHSNFFFFFFDFSQKTVSIAIFWLPIISYRPIGN